MTYVSVKWQRDPALPGACPLVIHLPMGDVGEEQLATEGELLKRGFQEVPYPPMPPEAAALMGPDWDSESLGVVRFGLGDLRVATQHTAGNLTGVWIWIVEPGPLASFTSKHLNSLYLPGSGYETSKVLDLFVRVSVNTFVCYSLGEERARTPLSASPKTYPTPAGTADSLGHSRPAA